MTTNHEIGWLLVLSLATGITGCSRGEVSIAPDPAARSHTSSASPAPVGNGQGGLVANMNTPETDPDQYERFHVLVNSGDPPTKIVEGPMIITSIFAWYSEFYMVQGSDCSAAPAFNTPGVGAYTTPEGRVPVQTGMSLCLNPYPYSGDPVEVFGRGYRPYR